MLNFNFHHSMDIPNTSNNICSDRMQSPKHQACDFAIPGSFKKTRFDPGFQSAGWLLDFLVDPCCMKHSATGRKEMRKMDRDFDSGRFHSSLYWRIGIHITIYNMFYIQCRMIRSETCSSIGNPSHRFHVFSCEHPTNVHMCLQAEF